MKKERRLFFVSALFYFSTFRLVLKPVTVNFHVWLPMFVANGSYAALDFIFAHVGRDSE
jgi:hypothetical protein